MKTSDKKGEENWKIEVNNQKNNREIYLQYKAFLLQMIESLISIKN